MNHEKEAATINIFKVPQLAWHGPRDLALPMPDSWDVEVCNMAGYDRPALNDAQIKAAVNNLIGMPPLREFAKGKKEAVIIVDDMTRVTRAAKIIPFVLEELNEAGIADNRIRFIIGLGNHAALDRQAMAKKLGETALARVPAYNHNPHYNCTYVGTTSRGTKLSVNAEVMNCDVKIAISSCTPHPGAVFGGGGKMILPAIASIDSVEVNHALARGPYDANPMRLDMEEIAALAGLDVAIECIVNMWGDTVALYMGAESETHEAAVKEARDHYLCPKAQNKDIVIANTYAKAMESVIGTKTAVSFGQNGGTLVLIAHAPEGQVIHYLAGVWGRTIGGRQNIRFHLPPSIQRLIIYTEYPDIAGLGFIDPPDKIIQLTNWADVIRTLRKFHGDSAAVALYPNADILTFGDVQIQM